MNRSRRSALILTAAAPLLLGAMAAAACDGAEPCARGCVEKALVDIFETDARGPRAHCMGAVVRVDGGRAHLVTAAHCVGEARRLRIRRAGEASFSGKVSAAFAHPRYQATAGAAYDIAVLEVEQWPHHDVVPLSHHIHGPYVTIATQPTPPWLNGKITARDALTLTVSTPAKSLRPGHSGAPVITVTRASSQQVVGVVSRGGLTSSSAHTIARIDERQFEQLIRHQTSMPAESCAQCAARMAGSRDPCSTAVARCRAAPSCSKAETCLQDCTTVHQERECMVRHVPHGIADSREGGAWMRCLCARCPSCPGACATTDPTP